MANEVWKNPIAALLLKWIQHYNGKKYWRRRAIVVDGSNKTCRFLNLYYLLWIKRVDAHHNASMGTSLNAGAQFITPPTHTIAVKLFDCSNVYAAYRTFRCSTS